MCQMFILQVQGKGYSPKAAIPSEATKATTYVAALEYERAEAPLMRMRFESVSLQSAMNLLVLLIALFRS